MKKNEELIKKIIFIIASIFLLFAFVLWLPVVQNIFLAFGEKLIGRSLRKPELWCKRIYAASFFLIFLSVPLFYLSYSNLIRKNKKIQTLFIFLGLLGITFLATSLLSTFPLGSNTIDATDQSVFMYIGRNMHAGKLPYKDMFDHKGIFLYFLQFLGTFVDGLLGIYLIEFASIFITAIFIFKITGLKTENKFIQFFATFYIIYFCGQKVYSGGNLTEEYALPCIAYAHYVFLKYLQNEKCNFRESLLSGISFVLVFFLRANMIAPWISYWAYLFVVLVKQKKFSVFKTMLAGFIAGAAIAFAPILLYFLVTQTFDDMWDSYILFNFKYISDEGGIATNFAVAKMFLDFFFLPFICLAYDFLQNMRRQTSFANALAFFVTLFFVAISGRKYWHYGIILLPFFALPTAYALEVLKNNVLTKKKTLVIAKILAFLSIAAAMKKIPIKVDASAENKAVAFLQEQTSPQDDVLVLGNDVRINLSAERYTRQRFFYQLPVVKQNPEFLKNFIADVTAHAPDYIVLPNYRKNLFFMDDDFSAVVELLKNSYNEKKFDKETIYAKKAENSKDSK